MHLAPIDWFIVVVSLAVTFLPAIFLARRAGKNATEFFAAGRQAPWWLIGISLVATTFSTDTPNLVTNLVRQGGVSANWTWWAFLLTGMATVFFYARLWRRSGVLTDLELYELRYSGKGASFVRGFRAVYLGLFFNCVIIATVNLAAAKIAAVLFGWHEWQTLLMLGAVPVLFAAISGVWGVMVTDLLQFCITMTSAFAAAFVALHAPGVGGLHAMLATVQAAHPRMLSVLPDFGDIRTAATIFIIPLTVQWWSVWYPGSEPGGGSYVAQRMLAARTEKDASVGTLLFQVMHYALRPWPWIIVALASTIVFPTVADIAHRFPNVDAHLLGDDIAYPAMLTFLPAGLAGFMVAGLFAAYRSTLETHLNWGTSYLVHDLYRRFIVRDRDERHYVRVARVTTALIMVVAIGVTFLLDTASQAFHWLLDIGAGTGLIYLLRWFWWRINAWSEVAAMASSFVISGAFIMADKLGAHVDGNTTLIVTVALTTATWVLVTYLTAPADDATLARFYRLVRPGGPGWRRLHALVGDTTAQQAAERGMLPRALAGWTLGLLAVYGALFGTGALLYGHLLSGGIACAIAVGAGILLLALL